MKTSENVSELFTALAKAQGQIENAPKDADNPFFKSRYTTLSAIRSVIRKPLSENGLAIIQTPIDGDNSQMTVITRLCHSSGEWVETSFSFQVAGKNYLQAAGSAITYARRYQLAAMLGIASDDDNDAQDIETEKPKQQPQQRQSKRPANPMNPSDVLRYLAIDGTRKPSENMFKAFRASLGKLAGDNESAKKFIQYIYGVESSTELKAEQVSRFLDWVDSDSSYKPNMMTVSEFDMVMRQIESDSSTQEPLFPNDIEVESPNHYESEA